MSQEVADLVALLRFMNNTSAGGSKVYCRLARLPALVAQQVAAVLGISETEFNLLIDSDGVRHTLAQHGVAKAKA
nr:hypothetical protein [Tanacetum cinerariifolium]